MSCSIGIGIIVWIYLLNITVIVVRGQSGGPNAVALINGQTMLDCTIDVQVSSNWRHSPDGLSNYSTISTGCGPVTGSSAAYYRTELIGGNICRLTIANVTMQQAGVYACNDGGLYVYRSLVTVIEPAASIVVYNQSEVVERDQLNISCSITYNGPTSPAPSLRPSPYWMTSPEQIFNSATYNTSGNIITMIATVTVQKPTVPVFQCNTAFEITGSSTNYNSTAPADNMTVGSTKELDVQYPIGKISINTTVPSEDNCVSKPETLTCTADANPPAHFFWLDLNNNTRTPGAIMSISSGGDYQCFGSNIIRSQTYNETKSVTETSCYPVYNLTMSGFNCANNSCACSGNQSSFILTCTAFGNPEPMIEWRTDVDFENFGNGTIVATVDGQYDCIASNVYGGIKYNATPTESFVVTDCKEPSSSVSTPPSLIKTTTPEEAALNTLVGPIVGAVIGVFVIANVVAICLFFWYYKRVEVSHSGKFERNNKLRLDRRFPWLKKMMPCVSDTKESAGSNCLWVSLFILLGTVTGIVTFPIWIILAKKYEKNNETSALTRRANGDGNGSGENGRRPVNISSANHSQPPPANQMNAIRREDPYQNESSRENIELKNSLRSGNLLLPDSPQSRPPPAGRPPPPPNKPTINMSQGRSKDYTVNDETPANPEHTTYADLPFVPRNTLPTATPVQFLNVSNDTYAALNKT